MDRTHDPTPGPLKRHFLRNILALTKVASETRTPRAVGSLSHIHVSVTVPRFNQPQSLTGGHRPRPGKRSETKLSPPTAAPYLSSHAAGGSPPSAVSVVFVPSLASSTRVARSLAQRLCACGGCRHYGAQLPLCFSLRQRALKSFWAERPRSCSAVLSHAPKMFLPSDWSEYAASSTLDLNKTYFYI